MESVVEQTNGEFPQVRMSEIKDATVILYANHSLARQSITYGLLLVDLLRTPVIDEEFSA